MIDPALADLIARQGPGARYDAPGAPADDLLAARRATAHVARLLNDLTDAQLVAGRTDTSISPAGSIARVALEARRMSEVIAVCRLAGDEGLDGPGLMPSESDITEATMLPPHALRHLFDHTRAHLNVEWRDLTDDGWASCAVMGESTIELRSLPSIRLTQLNRAVSRLETSR